MTKKIYDSVNKANNGDKFSHFYKVILPFPVNQSTNNLKSFPLVVSIWVIISELLNILYLLPKLHECRDATEQFGGPKQQKADKAGC